MDEMTQKFVVDFLYSLAGVLVPVLATMVAGYAIQGIRYLEQKIKNERPDVYATLMFVAKEAVHAAEQSGFAGLVEDKKAFALAYLQRELDARGIKGFDLTTLEDKIEAAVFEEINRNKVLYQ
jgi:hypothetical protein